MDENCPFIDKKWWFSIAMLIYQRVNDILNVSRDFCLVFSNSMRMDVSLHSLDKSMFLSYPVLPHYMWQPGWWPQRLATVPKSHVDKVVPGTSGDFVHNIDNRQSVFITSDCIMEVTQNGGYPKPFKSLDHGLFNLWFCPQETSISWC